tara:strand:- start:522 stop:731 length:210 start_codon:yes stop_codon:yes gene_type:complete
MTLLEKAVAELHRQGLSNAEEYKGKVYIGAWVDDLEDTIEIEVHHDQVKELAEDYEKSEDYVNLPFIWK